MFFNTGSALWNPLFEAKTTNDGFAHQSNNTLTLPQEFPLDTRIFDSDEYEELDNAIENAIENASEDEYSNDDEIEDEIQEDLEQKTDSSEEEDEACLSLRRRKSGASRFRSWEKNNDLSDFSDSDEERNSQRLAMRRSEKEIESDATDVDEDDEEEPSDSDNDVEDTESDEESSSLDESDEESLEESDESLEEESEDAKDCGNSRDARGKKNSAQKSKARYVQILSSKVHVWWLSGTGLNVHIYFSFFCMIVNRFPTRENNHPKRNREPKIPLPSLDSATKQGISNSGGFSRVVEGHRCKHCDKIEESSETKSRHNCLLKYGHICHECKLCFYSKTNLYTHRFFKHSSATGGFQCRECPFKGRNYRELAKHIEAHHRRRVNDERRVLCSICNKTLSEKNFKRHVNSVHKKNIDEG